MTSCNTIGQTKGQKSFRQTFSVNKISHSWCHFSVQWQFRSSGFSLMRFHCIHMLHLEQCIWRQTIIWELAVWFPPVSMKHKCTTQTGRSHKQWLMAQACKESKCGAQNFKTIRGKGKKKKNSNGQINSICSISNYTSLQSVHLAPRTGWLVHPARLARGRWKSVHLQLATLYAASIK